MTSKLLSLIGQHRKILLFAIFCFLLIPATAHAQYSLDDHNKALADPAGRNKQKFDQQTLAGFINSANTTLIGCQEDSCPKELKVGAIGVTGQLVASLYANPPASGVAYVQDVIHRINPVQPAYAQTGTGFEGLRALRDLWRAFRNLAYVAFAIVFVAIGLAVMFRMRLDPRTVLTLQSAIPRIVVALLLVTFSYAIAGFMIDLLYVLIALAALVFGGISGNTAELQNQFTTGDIRTALGILWQAVGGNRTLIIGILLRVAGVLASALIPGPIGTGIGLIGLGATAVLLVLAIIMLYLLVRLFFELLKAYIGILIAVILGPLQIAIGVIPGVPGFGAWFKGLAANTLAFPAVAFVLMLGQVLINVGSTPELWSPPLMVGGGRLLPIMIGFGILMIAYQVPQAIKNVLGIRGLGFAVGEAVGVITGPVSSAMEARARQAPTFRSSVLWGAGARLFGSTGGGRR